MNILITAGGTSEKIDDVRHLTNHATGSLGKEIVAALQTKKEVKIYYIYGPQAVLPEYHNIEFFPIHSVKDLYSTMEDLLTSVTFDFVIHSMAVSDYELDVASNEHLLAQHLSQQIIEVTPQNKDELEKTIKEALLNPLKASEPSQKKISSKSDELILIMKKAPKVISSIKKWQPATCLIGFKLLVDVSEEELVSVSKASLEKNKADWILANDLLTIEGDKHVGLLVSKTGIEKRFNTKQEIALGLTQLMLSHTRKDD